MRVRWHIRSILYGLLHVSEPAMHHGGIGRLGCGRPTPDHTHHDDQQPPPAAAQQQQQAKPARKWHIRGVLLTTVPVVASVGTYDAPSRIHRQSLWCGCVYVYMYSMHPDSRPRPPRRSTTNCHQTKLLLLQQQQAPSNRSRKNRAREMAHPGCSLWLLIAACIGAYDAAPRMDSTQSWGHGRMYSMTYRLQTTSTTMINIRHPKKN